MKKNPFATIFLVLLFLLTVSEGALGFSGSNSAIDSNLTNFFTIAVSNAVSSASDIKTSFVIGSIPSGTWSNGSYNLRVGVYFDQNLPVVTILSPVNNTVVTEDSVTVLYSAASEGNPIAKYWVKLNTGNYIDNELNTSYTFSGLETGTNTIYVKAMDSYDLNSLEYSVAITKPAAESESGILGSWNPFFNASRGDSSSKPPENLVPETAFDNLSASEKNYFAGKRIALPDEIKITRTFEILNSEKQAAAVQKKFRFVIIINNISGNAFENVSIVEYIPKKIVQDSAEITFDKKPFRIIRTDPIIEWTAKDFAKGNSVEFAYSLNALDNAETMRDINSFMNIIPTVLITETPQEKEICATIDCDDNNICTKDYCSKGKCIHSANNDVPCGIEGTCNAGTCKEIWNAANPDWVPATIIAFVFLVFVALIISKFRKPEKKPKWKA